MRVSYFKIVCLSLLFIGFVIDPSFGDNLAQGVQQPLDWQSVWGGINFSGGADPGIPSSQLQAKADIKAAVTACGTATSQVGLIRTYTVDFTGDGLPGIITDASDYFTQYMTPNCALQICNADGCYLSLYVTGQPSNLISASGSNPPACPASAAANTSCVASCPAEQSNCPALFQYPMRGVYDQRVQAWSFMSAASFQAWAASSYVTYNSNPVLVAKLSNQYCYNDELTLNNNQCIKYYQYAGDANTGSFRDLYNYQASDSPAYNTRFTYDFSNFMLDPFDLNAYISAMRLARGTVIGSGFGLRLNQGGTLDIQFANFARTNPDGTVSAPSFTAFHIVNNSTNDLFVPTNTDQEFSSFLNAASGLNVTVGPEKLRFTDWVGDTQCPAVVTAPETVAAQRFCISSTSDYRPCSDCMAAATAVNGAGWPGDWQLGCSVSQQCAANACVLNGPYVQSVGGDASQVGAATTLNQCLAGQGFWTTTTWGGPDWGALNVNNPAQNGWTWQSWCTVTFSELCAGEVDCIADDVTIRMAGASERPVAELKPGDMVLGFRNPAEPLKPYRVKLVAVTPKQNLLEINGELRVSPDHLVVTGEGLIVRASQLKVGDGLLRGDGGVMTVKSISSVAAPRTVYNLKLEDDAGFVAGGVRVMGYRK